MTKGGPVITIRVRWAHPEPRPLEYELLDEDSGKWVPITRDQIEMFLKRGDAVLWNPTPER